MDSCGRRRLERRWPRRFGVAERHDTAGDRLVHRLCARKYDDRLELLVVRRRARLARDRSLKDHEKVRRAELLVSLVVLMNRHQKPVRHYPEHLGYRALAEK